MIVDQIDLRDNSTIIVSQIDLIATYLLFQISYFIEIKKLGYLIFSQYCKKIQDLFLGAFRPFLKQDVFKIFCLLCKRCIKGWEREQGLAPPRWQ